MAGCENAAHHSPAESREAQGEVPTKSQGGGEPHEREVAPEQETSRQVPEGVPAAGYPVALIGGGDLGQERIVEDDARAKAQVGENEERAAPTEVENGTHEEQETGGPRTQEGKQGEQALLDARIVRDRAQKGQQEHLQEDGQ